MKTKRLYYTDSILLAFKSRIVEVREEDNKFITILEKTAFYPTSGGQQHDIGLLHSIEVVDVIDGDQILHITNEPVGKVGEIVSGMINYKRRQKNKQQHSAQHILSQAFYRLYKLETKSVHLGENYGNIEFETKEITDTQVQKAEILANQVIQENREVKPLLVQSEHLGKYNLRRPTDRTGEIRLIEIDDFECSACGGTHVHKTSEIQLIKIISTEKIRGRVAINFFSGQQAIDDYRIRFAVSNSIAQNLTCSVEDIESHFDKIVESNKLLKREVTLLQKELMPQYIENLLNQVEVVQGINVIFTLENRFDKNNINQFALTLAEKCNGIAVLLYKDKIILSCAENTQLHAGEFAKKLSVQTSLKGGGNKNIAQLGTTVEKDFELYKTKIAEIIAIGKNEN